MFAYLIVIMIPTFTEDSPSSEFSAQMFEFYEQTKKGRTQYMKRQTCHSQIYSHLVITAQPFGCGDIGPGGDACMVSFVSIHLSICMYLVRTAKHILGSKWDKE